MLDLEWMSLLLGLALSVDLACAKCRHWHAKQLAIKRDTTLNMSLLRDFRRDWGRWSAGERLGALLAALMAFGAPAAMFITAHSS